MSKDKKKTLRERQLEFFKSRGMSEDEAVQFVSWHGRSFEPNNHKDYQPESTFKETP